MFNRSTVSGVKDVYLGTDFITYEIQKFKSSPVYRQMIVGESYFVGDQDILKKQRVVVGEYGRLEVASHLPNNKIVDNQYRKAVIQKSNYLLGKPLILATENSVYSDELTDIFNDRFRKILKNVGEDSLNCGIGYMFVGIDDDGLLKFTRLKPFEIIPIWEDAEHEKLNMVIRVYETSKFTGYGDEIIQNVEVYKDNGIDYYTYKNNRLVAVEPYHKDYLIKDNQGYAWDRIPVIPFKYNSLEVPLIKLVKPLQDGLNTLLSNFQDNMEENIHNTVMVLVNYDGENLGEFRRNLATYGAVKVRSTGEAPGDVKTLSVEVNAENYKALVELHKKAIVENAMGYDAKDDRMGGNANQMNIQSMYNDIDLDTNGTETEYRASFENLLWFVNTYLENSKKGDFENEKVEVIFNRDMLMNEAEIMDNLNKSISILSTDSILANHPWVNDVEAEKKKLNEDKEKDIKDYENAFKVGDTIGQEK
ncbi:MAG: phage portal protein [Lachnospirales bacterium]